MRSKLCPPCYSRMIALERMMPIPSMVEKALTGREPEAKYELTTDHESCDVCPAEIRRLGHDPCLGEHLEFDYEIEELPSPRYGKAVYVHRLLRLFSFLVGTDSVTEDGDYVEMWDKAVIEWLESPGADISSC